MVAETIRIGDDIEVTVVGVQRDTVRLSITALREVRVHRQEVYLLVQAENASAAQNAERGLSVLTGASSCGAFGHDVFDHGAFGHDAFDHDAFGHDALTACRWMSPGVRGWDAGRPVG